MEDAKTSYRDCGVEYLNLTPDDVREAYTPLGDRKGYTRKELQEMYSTNERTMRYRIAKKVKEGKWILLGTKLEADGIGRKCVVIPYYSIGE